MPNPISIPPPELPFLGFQDSGERGGDTQAISFAGNPTETAAFSGRPPFL